MLAICHSDRYKFAGLFCRFDTARLYIDRAALLNHGFRRRNGKPLANSIFLAVV
jgi:hypothetical protein